jgi:hypothetical protein
MAESSPIEVAMALARNGHITPEKSLYTGQSVGTVTANPQIAVFFFRSTMISPGG